MNQIFTIVEGRVSKDKWSLMRDGYEKVNKSDLPDSLLSSHLTQASDDPEIWRIVTIWENIEAMKAYRNSVETPAWILIFKRVGAEPKLIVNEILLSK